TAAGACAGSPSCGRSGPAWSAPSSTRPASPTSRKTCAWPSRPSAPPSSSASRLVPLSDDPAQTGSRYFSGVKGPPNGRVEQPSTKDQSRARATVLVVDDEPSFQETIARYLSGYRRLAAYNGHQAMEILAKNHVDVILLDLNLPDTTGLKMCQALRAERDDLE